MDPYGPNEVVGLVESPYDRAARRAPGVPTPDDYFLTRLVAEPLPLGGLLGHLAVRCRAPQMLHGHLTSSLPQNSPLGPQEGLRQSGGVYECSV